MKACHCARLGARNLLFPSPSKMQIPPGAHQTGVRRGPRLG